MVRRIVILARPRFRGWSAVGAPIRQADASMGKFGTEACSGCRPPTTGAPTRRNRRPSGHMAHRKRVGSSKLP